MGGATPTTISRDCSVLRVGGGGASGPHWGRSSPAAVRCLTVALLPVCACVCCSLPLPTARARFVRALIWANPVYLQAIGKILYENTTDDVRPVPRCQCKELRVCVVCHHACCLC